MFPKKGKVFPADANTGKAALSYTAVIRAALREELGDSHRGVKVVMKWTGASERSAKNWLSGAKGPSGDHLLLLVRHSDVVLKTFLQSAGRDVIATGFGLQETRKTLAEMLKSLETLLNTQPNSPAKWPQMKCEPTLCFSANPSPRTNPENRGNDVRGNGDTDRKIAEKYALTVSGGVPSGTKWPKTPNSRSLLQIAKRINTI